MYQAPQIEVFGAFLLSTVFFNGLLVTFVYSTSRRIRTGTQDAVNINHHEVEGSRRANRIVNWSFRNDI